MLAILILAAGQSSRMRGADKLLQDIDGTPLLTRIADAALTCDAQVFATLPPDRPKRNAALPADVAQILVSNAADGMGASLAAGVGALPGHISSVMILPGDMPDITAQDLAQIFASAQPHPDAILRAYSDATPGHPVVFPKRCFEALKSLSGDKGARDIIKTDTGRQIAVKLPGEHAVTDLDTPEDWAAWRLKRNEKSGD